MQKDDTYKDLSGKGKEAGALTNANVSYKGTATLTEMQAITDREYRVLFESMEQGVLGLDSDGRIIMANPAAQAMLGYSFDDLHGRTTFDPCWQTRKSDGSDLPNEEHPVTVAMRTGKQVNNVTMGLFQPGRKEHRWYRVSVSPQFHPNERYPYQVYIIFQDQTEEKERIEHLQSAEGDALTRVHELEAVFTAIADNVVVYDQAGQILEMSDQVREMLGGQEIVHFDDHSTRERGAKLALQDRQNITLSERQLPISRILQGEIISSAHAADVSIHRQDGVERYVSVSGSPMHDDAGKITGAVAIIQDVTERRELERRTQKALDAVLAMAEALVQETQEEIMEDKLSGENPNAGLTEDIVEHSLAELPCRLLGCQRVGIAQLDPESDTLRPMIVIGISQEHELHWRNSLQGVRLQNFLGDPRLVARLRSGQVLSLDASLPLFRDHPSYKMITPIMKGKQLIGLLLLGYGLNQPLHTKNELAIIQAIAHLASLVIEREKARNERDKALDELHHVNRELERANKVKNNFVSMVSHEFRTALTGIQGFSEIMRDKDLTVSEIKEFAVDIYGDARRLGRMISDMTDLDRMEAGRVELSMGWTDLNAIILDVTTQMRENTGNHTLRLQLANALPILPGDYEKLTQVMTCLLDNALKYSPDGGEIVIASVVEGNTVHVSVRDNGPSIPPVDLERIFESYIHAGLGKTRFMEGNGRGLSIVREIVQMHSGQVWAESLQGKGSVFHFTVPFFQQFQS
jgi:PAS domain S-box-containing protein